MDSIFQLIQKLEGPGLVLAAFVIWIQYKQNKHLIDTMLENTKNTRQIASILEKAMKDGGK